MSDKIRHEDRKAIIQSLRLGVVPRVGQHLIQVGRSAEIGAMMEDISQILGGRSSFRFIVGDYGAGKSFFIQLMRSIALEKKLVTLSADLNPDRRFHGTGGQARSLYTELTKNASTKAKPDGGAMPAIVERFVELASQEADASETDVESVIQKKLFSLTELVNGFDFSKVIEKYWEGYKTDNPTLQQDALRWLRGEFSTKTDARDALGVRTIVDDANYYDQIKLLAKFIRLSGFSGLLVCFDELVNLSKLNHPQARAANYEQILRILNDASQGTVEGLGFILSGTPQVIYDPRRGLFSDQALQSRLSVNAYAGDGIVDLTGPVIKLMCLSPEDLYVLLQNVRRVYFSGEEEKMQKLLPDAGIAAFLDSCSRRLGNDYFKTPRTTITSFINLLAVIEQNSQISWNDLIKEVSIERDTGGELEALLPAEGDDELASIKL